MTVRHKTCRDCRTTIPLLLLKDSNLYAILCGCYGSPNVKNWMCELCTFSQIRSHMYITMYVHSYVTQLKISAGSWSAIHQINIIDQGQSVMTPLLRVYSKFILPNWTLIGHILKSVRKLSVTDHYFELCVCMYIRICMH